MATSKTTTKKAKSRQRTSGKYVVPAFIMGIIVVVLGFSGILSLFLTKESAFLFTIRRIMQGIGGVTFITLPFVVAFFGILLAVCGFHKVDFKRFFLFVVVYMCVCSLITLCTFINGQGNLMPYIESINYQKGVVDTKGFFPYVQQVYAWGYDGYIGVSGGGMLGMVFSYPLYRIIDYFASILVMMVLLAVGIVFLFRIGVRSLISAHIEKAKEQKSKKEETPKTSEEIPNQAHNETAPMDDAPMQDTQIPPPQKTPPTHTPPQPNKTEQFYQPEESFTPESTDDFFDEWEENLEDYETWQKETQPIAHPFAGNVGHSWQENRPTVYREDGVSQANKEETKEEIPFDMDEIPFDMDEIPFDLDDVPPPSQESKWQQDLKKKQDALNQPQKANPPSKRDMPQKASPPSKRSVPQRESRPLTDRMPKQVFTDPAVPLTGTKVAIHSTGESGVTGEGWQNQPKMEPKSSINVRSYVAYSRPPESLLRRPILNTNQAKRNEEDQRRAGIIERIMETFKVKAKVMEIVHGPAVTRFAVQLADNVYVPKATKLLPNLSLALGTDNIRVEVPIPGTSYIGFEVPNKETSMVVLRQVLDAPTLQKEKNPLIVGLGEDVTGNAILCNISKTPHMLIAGATGSGKSVCINTIICSLLYRATPAQVRLIMIDPKQVELQIYNGIPHLLTPVVSEAKKAAAALNWVVEEMKNRYGLFKENNVRNLEGYNKKYAGTEETLPSIVVVIDEMADLMEVCRKEVEESVRRLAALARAAGIHLILATQRPSVDVITGVIKNNIPTRIAFTVSSNVDSRTIIDTVGAENLMGNGDMLFHPNGARKATRVQGCFVSDQEVLEITEFIKARHPENYDANVIEQIENSQAETEPDNAESGVDENEPLLMEAIRMAVEEGETSISLLRRRLGIGHSKAGRLVDEMAKRGIVSKAEGPKPRKTLITMQEYEALCEEE